MSMSEAAHQPHIGVSTNSLKDLPLMEAVALVEEKGYNAIEINPHLYGGPEHIDRAIRRELKDRLAAFEIVTVHPSSGTWRDGRRLKYWSPDGIRGNMASSDLSFRKESIDEYLTYVEFAIDVSADLILFHPEITKRAPTEEQLQANVEFVEIAMKSASDSEMLFGFETFYTPLIERIGLPNFGILFDIGHAAQEMEGGDAEEVSDGVTRLLTSMIDKVFQFHVHGAFVSNEGKVVPHRPFQVNTCIDYPAIVRMLRDRRFSGPLIFEIGTGVTQVLEDNVENALFARERILELWNE